MKRSLLFVLLLFSSAGLFRGQTLAQDGARRSADHPSTQIRIASRRLMGLVKQLHNQRRIKKYYENLPPGEMTPARRKDYREAEFQERQLRRQMEDVIWDLAVWKDVIADETVAEEPTTVDNGGSREQRDGSTEFEKLKQQLMDADPDHLSGAGGFFVRKLVIAGLQDPKNAQHIQRLMQDQDFRNKLEQFKQSPGGRKLIQEMRQDPALRDMLQSLQIDAEGTSEPTKRGSTFGFDGIDDVEFQRVFQNGGTARQ